MLGTSCLTPDWSSSGHHSTSCQSPYSIISPLWGNSTMLSPPPSWKTPSWPTSPNITLTDWLRCLQIWWCIELLQHIWMEQAWIWSCLFGRWLNIVLTPSHAVVASQGGLVPGSILYPCWAVLNRKPYSCSHLSSMTPVCHKAFKCVWWDLVVF
jgi:hypothetical protein